MHPVHRAELVAVGTELLLGEIVDTNTAFLAQELARRSVDVYWSQRVGDNRGRIAEALRSAAARSDLVVVCGGLGPTDDDLTREAIADVVGEEPRVDPALESALRERFSRFSRSMPLGNLKQAWLVPSAEPLPNAHGTAPGWFVRADLGDRRVALVALPGPPSELLPMWRDEVLPRLVFPESNFVARILKTHGVGESHLAERLAGLTDRANPSVATYAKRDGVHVRVAAKAADAAAAEAALRPVLEEVRARLDGHVWGEDEDDLAALVLGLLTDADRSLAVVDAATGGALSELLGTTEGPRSASGRSGPLVAAVIAWRDDAMAVLGVSDDASAGRTPGDDQEAAALAAHLAERVRARCAADYGVAVAPWWTTVAETVAERRTWRSAWAVAGPGGTESRAFSTPHSAYAARRERLAFTALVALWTQLAKT